MIGKREREREKKKTKKQNSIEKSFSIFKKEFLDWQIVWRQLPTTGKKGHLKGYLALANWLELVN